MRSAIFVTDYNLIINMVTFIHKKCEKESASHSIIMVLTTSTMQYLLFVVFLVAIIFRNQYILEQGNTKLVDTFDGDNYDGIECAYKFTINKPIKTWQKTFITIELANTSNCYRGRFGASLKKGGSVFRIQVFSDLEVFSSIPSHVGNEIYRGELMFSFPRKYTIIVMLSYVNGLGMESKRHVRPLLRQLPGSPFDVVIKKGHKSNNVVRYCHRNESGVAAGRWIKCGGAIPGLERCGAWISPEFDFDKLHNFRWAPFACQHHQYTNDEMKRCFAKNGWDDIVFAGDSHMRYRAYHWATRLYGSCHSCAKTHIKLVFDQVPRIEWVFDARGTRLPLAFPNISLPYEKYIHPKVRRSKFSWPFPPDAMQAKLYILNFGHWILRESNDVQFMKEKLQAYGQAAQKLQEMGKVVVWVNTISLPWRTDSSVVEWRENTSPYRVKQFNDVADKILQHYNIPSVNAFQISDGRIAATHDQTHYTKKLSGNDFGGAVENAITNVIINLLCNP